MGLLRLYMRSEVADLHRSGVRVRMIGDRTRMPRDIVDLVEHAETLTVANTGIQMVLALSYGSRDEMAAAMRALAADAAAGRVRRSEEHTSELQSLMGLSYAVFFLKNKKI